MVKNTPDVIKGLPNGYIPVFTLGEFRLMNTVVPAYMAKASDDTVFVLQRRLADKVFDKSLIEWGIPLEEAAAFKARARAMEAMRIVKISHLLRCLEATSDEFHNWMLTPSGHFSDHTPWSVIQAGGIEQVFKHLYVFVLDPCSPFSSFASTDTGEEKDNA
ncbi:hypothetical protein [uncultured Spongiibacter sp.]|uniref:hypothetical protein n=1 Tax=uncultured Spongiibacter sp. TaxID=870896 RepID=UPI002596597D|nr:hypothetical protein [uncultured Spongiibacter sp.]